MSAGGGQKLRPRSRSGAIVKHSTHSRSKETHSTHALKSTSPKNHTLVTPRHHLYFPLKDIRPYVNGCPDDAHVNLNATSRKGWETRVCEKSRSGQGQMRRPRSHSTSVFMEPWSKYETLQNYRNVVGTGQPVSIIRWNHSILNTDAQKFSRKNLNLNMSYNGEFHREPNISENPEHELLQGQLIESRVTPVTVAAPNQTPEKSEDMKTELYTELLKFLTDEWDTKVEKGGVMRMDRGLNMAAVPMAVPPVARATSPMKPMKPRNPITYKSVSFTPDTIFFERNLKSRFWIEINYRQQVRRIQRKRLGKIDLRVRAVKSCIDMTTSSTSAIEPSTPLRMKHRVNNKKDGFWDGIRKVIASIFTCQSMDQSPRRRIP